MRVGRDLLEQMALAGAARSQLYHVEVALDEGDHPHQRDIPRPRRHPLRLQADAAQQKVLPLRRGHLRPSLDDAIEDAARGELDRPHRIRLERPPALFLGDGGVIAEVDFGVEAARQHALILTHGLV
jgi:hypothetical protein